MSVKSILREQLFVRTLLDYISIFHYKDPIRRADGRKAMRHNKAGPSFHQLFKRFLNLNLRPGINRGRRLVQDQDRRQTQHDSCDTKKLLLSLGKIAAFFGDYSVIPVRHPGDKAVGVSLFCRMNDLLSCGLRISICNILRNRGGFQPGFLEHHPGNFLSGYPG